MTDWISRAETQRKKLGLKPSDVDKALGRHNGAYREWIDRGRAPSIENARSLARALGYTLAELFEGTDIRVNLFVRGITRGKSMWAEVPAKHAKVVPIVLSSTNLVSIEISRDDAVPELGYREGDIISGEKVISADNLKTREVIVETKDGRRLFGTLQDGARRGTFNIRPLKPGAEEVRDVLIEWAAPIQYIVRAQN